MKVYVAEREYDYEGFTILGVFSTREAAQAVCDADIRPPGSYRAGEPKGDGHAIEEFELDASNV
jgi:hypothetical protein